MLFALVCEKIIQHAFVTFAFYSDLGAIRATTAVDPDILMVLGASVTVGFVLALWALATRRRWAISLVIVLALFDLGGEFIAQGRPDIVITLSFAVAAVLLTLALLSRRATQGDASPPSDSGVGGPEAGRDPNKPIRRPTRRVRRRFPSENGRRPVA